MIVREEVLKQSEKRATEFPSTNQSKHAAPFVNNRELSAEIMARRVAHMSFAGAMPSPTEFERMIGTNDLVDEFYLERALVAAKPVCRLVMRDSTDNETGWATGFLISPRLLLTNWHVFRTKGEATNALAQFNYKLDIKGNLAQSYRFVIRPDLFYYSHRELDYCLVAVEQVSIDGGVDLNSFGYHSLCAEPGKIENGEWITIIEHPLGQPRHFAIRNNQLVEKQDEFLWYLGDTESAASGSPCFNDSFQVVALHHSGKAKKEGDKYVLRDGRLVDSLEGIDDGQIYWEKNEGLRISVLCADMKANLRREDPFVSELYSSMQTGGILSRAFAGSEKNENLTKLPDSSAQVLNPHRNTANVSVDIPLQLHVAVTYGAGTSSTFKVVSEGVQTRTPQVVEHDVLEKMVSPSVDPDYGNRKGYETDFLELHIPMPTVNDLDKVVTMEDGNHEIPYEHFSVVLDKKRRLALITGSNVNGDPVSRKPEPGDYTRKGLTGLGPNDREKWITDPRIPEKYQVPDDFYNKDGGAFDKGHIVRREDVCWGKSREQIIKACCDTFHVLNCSPQVAEFNQSGKGGLWGSLENEVLKQVKGDRYSLFAAPIFDDEDRIFSGKGKHGALPLLIPRRYWKVVVAKDETGLQAFAFILEQDLSNVPLERFVPDDDWVAKMISISGLEQETGNRFNFPAVVKKADQFGKVAGEELMRRADIKKFK